MSSSSASSPEISKPSTSSSNGEVFSYKTASYEDVLEDLSSRFILNLPEEELTSLERICFQVEQAHWFYEDFIREQNSSFPSLPLKKFSAILFESCPILYQWSDDHEQAFNTFMAYKTRVPVCGAIMLNDTWDKCVLVKGWKSSSGWGFPKGKINEDEPTINCAAREVLEETGYNLTGKINPDNVIEMTIKEQRVILYVVAGVPEDFEFKTKTRKEISKIQWFKLSDLPTWKTNKTAAGKFYLIVPFISPLKALIHDRKPKNAATNTPRKGTKPKKNNATPPRVQTHRTAPSSSSIQQESSSQSSSADAGDPQTPSPQYSESIAQSLSIVQGGDQQDLELDSTAIDPDLARVMSILYSSSPSVSKTEAVQPISMSPTTTADSGRTIRPTSRNSNSQNAISERSQKHGSLRPNNASTIEQSNNRSAQSLTANGPALASSSYSPVTETRKPTRRTSSTADISPYMSKRATTDATSVQKMSQLALLESVAEESAKMTAILALRSQIPPTNRDPRLNYPSAMQSPFPQTYSVVNPPMPIPDSHDPFVVRPHTSQSSHRSPYQVQNIGGSTSMGQQQLMSFMSGSMGLPPRPPFPTSPSYYAPPAPYGTVAPPYPHIVPQHMPGYGSMLMPQNYAPSAVVPSGSSGLNGPLPKKQNPASHNLLSILNGATKPNAI